MPIVVRKGIYVESGIIMSILEKSTNSSWNRPKSYDWRWYLWLELPPFSKPIYQQQQQRQATARFGFGGCFVFDIYFRRLIGGMSYWYFFSSLATARPTNSLSHEKRIIAKYDGEILMDSWFVNETNHHVYFMFYLALRCSRIYTNNAYTRILTYSHTRTVFVYKVKLLFFWLTNNWIVWISI